MMMRRVLILGVRGQSSTEVRHNDSSEFWWANAALAREDHPTLLSSRARWAS